MSDNASHECSLCYEDFSDEHPAVALPNCRHVYGQECIQKWMESDNAQHDKCPACRAPILDAPPPDPCGLPQQVRVHPIPDQAPVRRGPTVHAGDHPIRVHQAPTPQVARQPAYVPAEIREASHRIRHAPDHVHRVYPNSHRNGSFDSYSSASGSSYRFASSGSSYHSKHHYQPHHHHGHDSRCYHGHHCANQAPTGFRNRIRNLFHRRAPEPRCDHHSGGRSAGDTVVRIENHWGGHSAMRDVDAAMQDIDMMLDSLQFDHWD